MYQNLKAEMARFGITNKNIAECIEINDQTVSNRINGNGAEFSFGETVKIRDQFFPGMRLEYLFTKFEASA